MPNKRKATDKSLIILAKGLMNSISRKNTGKENATKVLCLSKNQFTDQAVLLPSFSLNDKFLVFNQLCVLFHVSNELHLPETVELPSQIKSKANSDHHALSKHWFLLRVQLIYLFIFLIKRNNLSQKYLEAANTTENKSIITSRSSYICLKQTKQNH